MTPPAHQQEYNNNDYPPPSSKYYSKLTEPTQQQQQKQKQQTNNNNNNNIKQQTTSSTSESESSESSSSSSLSSEETKNASQLSKKSSSFRYKVHHTAFGPLSINDFLRKDWIKYYILLAILLILVTIVAIYHHQIVTTLHPYAESVKNIKINDVPVGWIIPVIVLFIISFPPLFGHEIVIILCGLVWGLWVGFLIAAAGTLLGELANYFAFKYACSHRAAKLEKKDINYACMCRVIREGGFRIALLARLSTIPGHLVTPVFATTGMSLFIFTAATVISMPKQLAGVYLGTLFSENGDGLPKSNSSQIVKYSVLVLSFLVTIIAALYIYKKMVKVRKQVQDQLDNTLIQNNTQLNQFPQPTSHLQSNNHLQNLSK